MEDLISVIVPIYNVEKYINKCIDSIIDQTYTNLEIILVDDGSPDNCGKICDEYAKKDKRIRVIHKENGGVSSARNIGIETSKGKWITFVDSDDWLEKDFCNILLKEAIENKCNVALCGYKRVISNNCEYVMNNGKKKIVNSIQYLINSLNPQTGYGFCNMKLFNKECIKNTRFKEELLVGEDALFNEMISENIYKAIFVAKALYNYRINDNSVVRRYDPNYVNKYLMSIEVNKKYLFNKYNKNQEIIQNYYNYVAYHILLIAVNYCHNPYNNEKKQKNQLKQICNIKILKEGIENSNYSNISMTRKITLFTIKHKLYFLTAFICKYRQNQNRRD